ncbi:OLC1v1023000C2 [Oldenlandia corymbosa var. corymbosa]|uniref:non-specific serine/threonine protein kinase n=1 Tax=Oldenlandia corymbosa var. corymbosa TaxID=529605 RepID=A0AAV1BZ33_OLDCO|nr:OLC1v1023000C2 [Oldenlandia corymbosa var. corymbosa]
MKTLVNIFHLVYALSLLFGIEKITCLTDSLTRSQILKDGETIISAGGSFALGFFSPSMSTKRYLGIWYRNIPIQTVVWVANREAPLTNTTGFLEIVQPGVLVIRNEMNSSIWSSNSSTAAQNPVAQLLDTGNLVLKDANDDNPGNYIWQSFNYPSDTFLPGMKLGRNFVTGLEVHVTSWKSFEDPAPGEYTYHCDPTGYPQNFISSGSGLIYRTGSWNGQGFSGVPGLTANPIFSFEVVFDSEEVYYSFKLLGSTITRFTLSPSGVGQRWTWDNQSGRWNIYLSAPNDNCDSYGLCGSFGSCDVGNSAICGCLDKFKPKNPENWGKGVWSDGCIRKTELDCDSGDGFLKYSNFKLPDTHNSTYNRNISLEECRTECSKNCSCTAYSSLDIRNGGSGCLLWFGDLIDMKVMPGAGQDIYIRLAPSELVSSNDSRGKKVKIPVIVLLSALGMVLFGLGILFYTDRRKKKHQLRKQGILHDKDYGNEHHNKEIELPLFEFSRLLQATNNFSSDKKLGEGGYGPVYWGKLEDGQEVAVKRLSEHTQHGVDQFMTEAICIAKLQHRNLVKLLGYCIEGDERILIYEFMANKSLDYFIFDQKRSRSLNWQNRFHIIQGIARGLQYLHQDSRLRVIHRDIKASNILLDADLNPKISDFGTARSFGGNETGDNTVKVVGTHGYMPPEYVGDGLFSVKSDVFSFGVLVLEIISGKRNRMFVLEGHNLNILGHAWRFNRQGRALELVDSNLTNSYCSIEVLRAIHVGLLCVQQSPEDRPDMSSVVFMLGSSGPLPEATRPGFFVERNILGFHMLYRRDRSNRLESVNKKRFRLLVRCIKRAISSSESEYNNTSSTQLLYRTQWPNCWISFDYPTDTLLPGMKLGLNFVTGLEVYLSSWKSSDDPAPGQYTYIMDPAGFPQKMIKNGSSLVYRTGPWNGFGFNGFPSLTGNNIFSFQVVYNNKEVYYTYKLLSSTVSRVILNPNGVGERWIWENRTASWKIYLSLPSDACDTYGLCGAYGSCNLMDLTICGCLEKFQPKNPENWSKGDWSEGCVRTFNCSERDGFRKLSNLKLPNVQNSTVHRNTTLEECRSLCLKDCSCTAYSSLDIRNGGSGCLLWIGDLIDIKVSSASGEDIYIRMGALESGSDGKKGNILVWVLPLSVLIMILLGLFLILCIYRNRRNRNHLKIKPDGIAIFRNSNGKDYMNEHHKTELELPLFVFSRLVQATNNFSSENKLGEGGYGPVYWGRLEEGQEIAVKRLSEHAEQGIDEFKNEVTYIAKLQHRNLVKLLGCCIEGEEMSLIYEYMPNKSLDRFIFDPKKSTLLDWPKRFQIVLGIARGLLYLHQDSRLRIIHRDLKAANILLDSELNPKISDFGIAKSFGGNETEDKTRRVVGTQGYMSPEYAGEGHFSVKSDVFSFGVLLLEIISGKRNKVFMHEGHYYNLLGHAWMLNREGRALELVESNLGTCYCGSQALRAIRVGLLCVQQCPEDRPEMCNVVFMLGNEGPVPEATQPGFFMERYKCRRSSPDLANSIHEKLQEEYLLFKRAVWNTRTKIYKSGGSFALGFFSPNANDDNPGNYIWQSFNYPSDTFLPGMKLVRRNISLEECRTECLKKCSCTAYSSLDIRNGGSGCLLCLCLALLISLHTTLSSNDSHGKKVKVLVTVLPLALGMVLLGLSALIYTNRRKKKHQLRKQTIFHDKDYANEYHNKEIELPLSELSRLLQATKGFSSDNKLGEGGYGPVYWGKLEDGQEVAVKRLSENTQHDVDQFMTEAICIAKLQHRNLVKLLGCCIEGDEKILIYEYMANKSLDYFIFEYPCRVVSTLVWPKRFHIIQGIARGLLYLHQDSRLRVIHRDLKASNILLDSDLNPKISDFGTDRSFGGNETGDNTVKVVGTHGYMSPEYAGDGHFSVKSDVFSFGVLVLEIISGKRNRMFIHEGHNLNIWDMLVITSCTTFHLKFLRLVMIM